MIMALLATGMDEEPLLIEGLSQMSNGDRFDC